MAPVSDALAGHLTRCPNCYLTGPSLLDDRLCPIGERFAHEVILAIADERAERDYRAPVELEPGKYTSDDLDRLARRRIR